MALLLWAWLFTLPGLLLTALGVGQARRAPPVGRAAGACCSWRSPRSATGAHAEFELPNWLPFLPDGAFHLRVDPLAR